MLQQQRKQNIQAYGVQMAGLLYPENKVDGNLLFNNLIRVV
jgi:hypothetical protein